MAEHGVEGYNNSGVSTQLIGDFIEVPHEKPWRYQEGDLTVTRGSAWSGPGCHDGCGVLLYTDKDGKLVKVEGDRRTRTTRGACASALDVPEVTLQQGPPALPMKRDPKDRGKDKWERISWDEAIDLVADTFLDIKEKYGAEGRRLRPGHRPRHRRVHHAPLLVVRLPELRPVPLRLRVLPAPRRRHGRDRPAPSGSPTARSSSPTATTTPSTGSPRPCSSGATTRCAPTPTASTATGSSTS